MLLLQLRVADSGTELNEALKLYRDMNHLSLAGGITCEQVITRPTTGRTGSGEGARFLSWWNQTTFNIAHAQQ